MGSNIETLPPGTGPISPKQIAFASASFLLGLWTFRTVNAISGPQFEPIIAACTDPSIAIEEFAAKTGYHVYEPRVGLQVFNFLVCLITQFLFELRQTPPAGLLVWCGIIVVVPTYSIFATVEAARHGARGPIRYPMIFGMLGQLIGISVTVPLLWVPSYILGGGTGPVHPARSYLSVLLCLPTLLLTVVVFTADVDGSLWTTSAGILGGPGLVLCGAALWPVPAAPASPSPDYVRASAQAIRTAYRIAAAVAAVGYLYLLRIAHAEYGWDVSALWRAVWTEAGSSVAFMTVDTIVLYVGVLSYVACRSGAGVVKAALLTPFVGPAAASLVLAELEEKRGKEKEL
mmetsp:Transcript_20188/g.40192  ORF Transcript_20188/g.40192 Transcript_20188/m.40192 type:complete len:345 (+) Transcript_20188:46-1080(+)|eukprot:CAMPEP_0194321060 /NCGR_PEP_ID=MMETSP0171-20130528/17309_1 /TAXON_ID=218684 /ORGANISM="Corethron pennatum, Strain L29A3" /LENGTH=344 /DNA_ID=CAMNT_0039078805 /DNA_START=42 /DNA_END=1076 /DNA_ORIENTATION=-